MTDTAILLSIWCGAKLYIGGRRAFPEAYIAWISFEGVRTFVDRPTVDLLIQRGCLKEAGRIEFATALELTVAACGLIGKPTPQEMNSVLSGDQG